MPTGYLSASGIQSCLIYLANTYSSISQLILLPEASGLGSAMRAVKIGKSSSSAKPGVLLLGGLHARELVNPDALVGVALKLCQAYTGGGAISLGGKTYEAPTIKLLVEALDIFVFPLVNPDGRSYVQAPGGDPWWRKNRRPIPGSTCVGVDLNRNFDLLWSSGIGTSADPCDYQIYKGTSAFSESETRNVRWMMDHYPIKGMLDVHSYSELVLYPWGDDNNQSVDPNMNFKNPAFDGLRGIPGDSVYKEYIPSADQTWFSDTANRIRDAIAAVRGRTYTAEQSVGLYPTSATSDDYAYSRYFALPSTRKVRGMTVETGTAFQPTFPEAGNVMNEAMVAALEYCVASICAAEEISAGLKLADKLEKMRVFRDDVLLQTRAGRKYAELLRRHTAEILTLAATDKELRKLAQEALEQTSSVALAEKKVVDGSVITHLKKAVERFGEKASPAFKESLKLIAGEMRHFEGVTVRDGLIAASGKPSPTPTRKTARRES